MKLAAVVILYNPQKTVITNITSYLNYVDKVFIIDNSHELSTEVSDELKILSKTEYIWDGENKGIANRLNQACKLSIEEGFNWLLTMDQDSRFTDESIRNYISCLKQINSDETSMVGVEYINKGITTVECHAEQVTTLITSGSFVNLNLFSVVGEFDEALFIDFVDFDYCYRSLMKKLKIMQLKNIYLEHQLGETSTHTSLKSLKKTNRSLHSPIRLYYMTRNYFYISSRYKQHFNEDIKRSKKDILNRIKNNILYGNERLLVIKMILKGFIDFRLNKMGKM